VIHVGRLRMSHLAVVAPARSPQPALCARKTSKHTRTAMDPTHLLRSARLATQPGVSHRAVVATARSLQPALCARKTSKHTKTTMDPTHLLRYARLATQPGVSSCVLSAESKQRAASVWETARSFSARPTMKHFSLTEIFLMQKPRRVTLSSDLDACPCRVTLVRDLGERP
jgi:hypothetical protein